MKILKESKKEKLPVSFLTNFISKGWERVGDFKEEITAVEQSFSSTQAVTKVLQDLVDAYLVAIGQMEGLLEEKKYIEVPEGAVGLEESLDATLLEAARVLTTDESKSKIDLEDDVDKILDQLILDEKEAIDGYRDALDSKAGANLSPKAREVLQHINDEEVEHIEELAMIAAGNEDEIELHSEAAKPENTVENVEDEESFVIDFDDVEIIGDKTITDAEIEQLQGIKSE